MPNPSAGGGQSWIIVSSLLKYLSGEVNAAKATVVSGFKNAPKLELLQEKGAAFLTVQLIHANWYGPLCGCLTIQALLFKPK